MKIDLHKIQSEAEQVVEMRRLNPTLYVPYEADPESDLALVQIARMAVTMAMADDAEQKLPGLYSALYNAGLLRPDEA